MVFLPLVLIEAGWESEVREGRAAAIDVGTYALGSMAVVAVNITLLHAVSLVFGLRITRPGPALRAAFVVVGLWIAVPLAVGYLILAFAPGTPLFGLVAFLSPFAIVYALESAFWPLGTPVWVPILAHAVGFGALAMGLHRICMRQADDLLGRE